MADNVLHSPGIMITETDKSFVPARPLIAGAALIGPTPTGPAFSPTVCTSYGDYERRFGTTFMMNRYAENVQEKVQEAEEQVETEITEQLDNQWVMVQDPPQALLEKCVENGGNLYAPYLEVLDQLEGDEPIYVYVED